MTELTREEALRMRLRSQLIGGSDLTPTQVVERAIALQGQDLPAVLRAIALRSKPGTTTDEVKAAFDRGELVRSWPVRGTLFATTPAHLRALLSLTGERIHLSTVRRRGQLGLDEAVLDRDEVAVELAEQDAQKLRPLELRRQSDAITGFGGRCGGQRAFGHVGRTP